MNITYAKIKKNSQSRFLKRQPARASLSQSQQVDFNSLYPQPPPPEKRYNIYTSIGIFPFPDFIYRNSPYEKKINSSVGYPYHFRAS